MRTIITLAALVTIAACIALPVQRNALDCQMCELAVKKLDGPADQDIKTAEKEFDLECKALFHSIPFAPAACQNYVNNKMDPIIKELDSGTAPKDVCTKLNECP